MKEKWSKEKHPAYQAGYRKPSWAAQQSDETPTASNSNITYKVNDVVLARWISGDKAFYPARITSVTGSASAPVYTVTFKSYNNTETVRGSDLKPHPSENKKRKLDGSAGSLQNNSNNSSTITNNQPSSTTPNPLDPSSSSISSTTNNGATSTAGNVISAAASINPTLANQIRKEPSKVSDGPPRPPKAPRKVKANKELEAGKSKWQDFNAKGKMAKYSKKESMFRTPTGLNARGMSCFHFNFALASLHLSLPITCIEKVLSFVGANGYLSLTQSASRARARKCARTRRVASTFTNRPTTRIINILYIYHLPMTHTQVA